VDGARLLVKEPASDGFAETVGGDPSWLCKHAELELELDADEEAA